MDKASIMSPNYPQNYDINSTCGYEIKVGEGHMISLKFSKISTCSNQISTVLSTTTAT
jgi:hypothetical protein